MLLHGLFDGPGAETTSAHANMFSRAVHDGVHALEIRVEHALRLVVGMTDVMT